MFGFFVELFKKHEQSGRQFLARKCPIMCFELLACAVFGVAQGRELPANARATRNDKAVASAKPSATAIGRGKPSGLIAISPQPWRRKLIIDSGGIMI